MMSSENGIGSNELKERRLGRGSGMRDTQQKDKTEPKPQLLEVEITAPIKLVPQILNGGILRGSAFKLGQLHKWSRIGSALWVIGTAIGILGGHIIIEAAITGLGLMSLAMGIFRAA